MIRSNKISGKEYSQVVSLVNHGNYGDGSTHQIACQKDDIVTGFIGTTNTSTNLSSTDFDILQQGVVDGSFGFIMKAKRTGTLEYTVVNSGGGYTYYTQIR